MASAWLAKGVFSSKRQGPLTFWTVVLGRVLAQRPWTGEVLLTVLHKCG